MTSMKMNTGVLAAALLAFASVVITAPVSITTSPRTASETGSPERTDTPTALNARLTGIRTPIGCNVGVSVTLSSSVVVS